MRKFRCTGCQDRKVEPFEWEHFHRQSFCSTCGEPGVEIVEWGCFECTEAGIRFYEAKDPTPVCKECGEPAVRIMYAPMIVGAEAHQKHEFADALLRKEVENRGMTDITVAKPKQPQGQFAPRWGNPSEIIGRGQALRSQPGATDGFGIIKSGKRPLTEVTAEKRDSKAPHVPTH